MHKRALEHAKRVMEEFCAISDPTPEQAQLYESIMCGDCKFIEMEYKAKIIDAMNKTEQEEEIMGKMAMQDQPMGYNERRYSSGRYAPEGRGKMYGYMPYINRVDMEGYNDEMDVLEKMGYDMGHVGNGMQARSGYNNMDGMNRSDHSAASDRYRESRKFYTKTKDPASKKKMDSDREDVFSEVKWMLHDMWDDMDPGERQLKKQTLMQTVQALPA